MQRNGPGPKRLSPIDIHIGARLAEARSRAGWSQERLGGHLGISFQQIQKYEKAKNRVTVSMLVQTAAVLGVPLIWFFEGLELSPTEPMLPPAPITPDQRALIEDWRMIENPVIRTAMRRLISETANEAREKLEANA